MKPFAPTASAAFLIASCTCSSDATVARRPNANRYSSSATVRYGATVTRRSTASSVASFANGNVSGSRGDLVGWHRGGGPFLDALPHLDDLNRAGRGWPRSPPLGPGVGVVVMPDIGEQEAGLGLVDDEPDVATRPAPTRNSGRAISRCDGSAARARTGSICRSNAVVLAAFCSGA